MSTKSRLVTTEAELDELERDRNDLADRISASYFSSFEYVRTAWTHFRGPTDRLCVVVVSDGPGSLG